MLSILGHARTACDGISRREILRAGGAGLFGLTLPKLLAAEQAGQINKPRAKSVLFVFLFGGPSQLETFDMKPQAASGIRGPFQPIQSRTPGLQICEHLPKLAERSDRYAVIRSLTHTQNDHNACHHIQTGHPFPPANRGSAGVNASEKDWPAMGSVVEYLDRVNARTPRDIPSYFYVPNRLGHIQGYDRLGQYGGWLGRSYDALATEIRKRDASDNPYFRDCNQEELDFRLQGLTSDSALTLDRLDERKALLEQFDAGLRNLDSGSAVHEFEGFRQSALSFMTAGKLRDALDINKEPANLRDRYGRHLFGQSLLMGRRLIEIGARFVTVLWDAPDGYSWDSHRTSQDVEKFLLPGLDQSMSALLDDLHERGLLDETLVVCLGEMGRSPKPDTSVWGRGHWSFCFPALLAGAGIPGGLLYGKSDKDAAYPTEHPVSPADMSATIFHLLGIDPQQFIPDRLNRPVRLTDGGNVLPI